MYRHWLRLFHSFARSNTSLDWQHDHTTHLEVRGHESVVDGDHDAGLLMCHLSDGGNVHDLHRRVCWSLEPDKLQCTNSLSSTQTHNYTQFTKFTYKVQKF